MYRAHSHTSTLCFMQESVHADCSEELKSTLKFMFLTLLTDFSYFVEDRGREGFVGDVLKDTGDIYFKCVQST